MVSDEHYQEMLFRAQLSAIAERYDDMAKEVDHAVRWAYAEKVPLEASLRSLFFDAAHRRIGARRIGWRRLGAEKYKYSSAAEELLAIVVEKADLIAGEIVSLCAETVEMIDTYVSSIAENRSAESEAFFLRMKADCWRYTAEVLTGQDRETASANASGCYADAAEAAQTLAATHPFKLGVALNSAVFRYDTLGDSVQATQIATTAFDAAVAAMDSMSEEHYRDSTLIMQLLRDNIALWQDGPGAEESQEYRAAKD
ncbi:14-3-3 family protein [Nocardia sp. NPDC057030]|uniref:14-3-3 family protein n=1 Tax=unclassified Nocardia TaxID=2637762 RepID=UPI003627B281